MKVATYLTLWHGRKSPDENLNDWGSNGPTFGPLDEVTVTYATHLKASRGAETLWLNFTGDLIEYEGIFYGDFTIFTGVQESDGTADSETSAGEWVKHIDGKGSAIKTTPLHTVSKKYLH